MNLLVNSMYIKQKCDKMGQKTYTIVAMVNVCLGSRQT